MMAKVLTEDSIVDAALSVVRRDGLDGLSMRALSRELGASPMAAYYYVSSKQELLDLVAARALADIAAPEPGEPWPIRLRTLIDRIDEALRHYRGVGEVLLDRMNRTQHHVMRAIMEILAGAGFGDADVAMGYALVHTYLFGRYRVTMTPLEPGVDEIAQPDDIVARVGPVSLALRGRDFYDFGADTLIRGLQARLEEVGAAAANTASRRATRGRVT
jgi:TetR/AcrR family tetracycline transcriptional repressor